MYIMYAFFNLTMQGNKPICKSHQIGAQARSSKVIKYNVANLCTIWVHVDINECFYQPLLNFTEPLS